MKIRFLTILLVSTVLSTFGKDNVVFTLTTYYAGAQYESVVTQEMLANAPAWKTNVDNPPLSSTNAQLAAISYAKQKFNVELKAKHISLKSFGDGHWIYIVDLIFPELDRPRPSDGFLLELKLIILMDGSVRPLILKSTIDKILS